MIVDFLTCSLISIVSSELALHQQLTHIKEFFTLDHLGLPLLESDWQWCNYNLFIRLILKNNWHFYQLQMITQTQYTTGEVHLPEVETATEQHK